ncbi:MAG: hypothetical protein MZV70_20455 [Desulfobacterales bacterium]|nr:hypothetical protein [Desulfobacterales bacterium]
MLKSILYDLRILLREGKRMKPAVRAAPAMTVSHPVPRQDQSVSARHRQAAGRLSRPAFPDVPGRPLRRDRACAPPRGASRLRCSDPALPGDETQPGLSRGAAFLRCAGPASGGCEIRARPSAFRWRPAWAGGSSNAASVLLGLNHLHGAPVPGADSMRLGRTLGADVPFFIFQSPGAGLRHRGRSWKPCPRPAPVARPSVVCPPLAAYPLEWFTKILNLRLTNCQKQPTRAHLKKAAFHPCAPLM